LRQTQAPGPTPVCCNSNVLKLNKSENAIPTRYTITSYVMMHRTFCYINVIRTAQSKSRVKFTRHLLTFDLMCDTSRAVPLDGPVLLLKGAFSGDSARYISRSIRNPLARHA
jgi:hypothetical protein